MHFPQEQNAVDWSERANQNEKYLTVYNGTVQSGYNRVNGFNNISLRTTRVLR